MYKIVRKKELNAAVTYMEIEAPFVARKAKAGQFIIFRVDEKSERVPLTIAGYDREKGTVAIIFQKVGLSTEMLGSLNEGDYIQGLRSARLQADGRGGQKARVRCRRRCRLCNRVSVRKGV